MSRRDWTSLTDPQLLQQCAVDTYRASGPGGQKRNKTSSAVRLRHLPSGLLVIAEESRSQHENKAKALKRLRQRLWLQLREPINSPLPPTGEGKVRGESESVRSLSLAISRRDQRFWPTVGIVLDVLEHFSGQVSSAANWLGISTGNLIDFLEIDDAVWTEANRNRQRHGHAPLRQG